MTEPENLNRMLAERRAEMAATVAELRSRTSARYLAAELTRNAVTLLKPAAPAVASYALRKPVGSALVSAGVAYLMFGDDQRLDQAVRQVASSVKRQTVRLGEASAQIVDKGNATVASSASAVAVGLKRLGSAWPSRNPGASSRRGIGYLEIGAVALALGLTAGLAYSASSTKRTRPSADPSRVRY